MADDWTTVYGMDVRRARKQHRCAECESLRIDLNDGAHEPEDFVAFGEVGDAAHEAGREWLLRYVLTCFQRGSFQPWMQRRMNSGED